MILVLAGLPFLLGTYVPVQPHVAYVLDMKGHWFLEGQSPEVLKASQKLPAKGVIRIISPTKDDYLVVAKLNGDVFIRLSCNPIENCQRVVLLPGDSDSQKSAVGIIFEAAMELLFGSPYRYSVHRTRENNHTLREAVVSLDHGKADLSYSFIQMPKGSYSVTLKNLTLTKNQAISSLTVGPAVLDWIPGNTATLTNLRLSPGVWELSVRRTDEDPYLVSPNISWILLVDKAHFEAIHHDFDSVVAATENWAKAVTPEAKRQVLRASLDHLAQTAR